MTESELGFAPLFELDEAWRHPAGGARLEAARQAAPKLRDAIAESGTVRAVRTFETGTFPYPTRYAFFGAAKVKSPYVWLTNRCLYVELTDRHGELRRLLINPSWAEGSRKAPYFQDLLRYAFGPLERLLGKEQPTVVDQLREAGIDPSQIDYLTFDHLHVQHVAPMLGERGFFPKAKLIVTDAERAIVQELHPLQRYWYVEGCLDGVAKERLVRFDRDLLLGQGVALVRTPGHTDGNHTAVLALPDGLLTTSENGVCAECYAPERSHLPGLADYAKRTGAEVILNANSRERTLDQYTSMIIERALSERAGEDFPRHLSSSELSFHPLAPRVRPRYSVGAVEVGALSTA